MKKALLATGLAPGFWAAIRRGRLYIPQESLRPFLEKALANEEGARLRRCVFEEDGISLDIRVKKAGSCIILPLVVSLDNVSINNGEQRLEASFACDRPVGDDLLGRLAAALARGLIVKMVAGRMAGNPDVSVAATGRGRGRIVIDLGGLPAVRKLLRRLPVVHTAVLDIVAVRAIRHVAGGVEVELARTGRRP
jgi:hypothetical protein